MFVHHPRSDHQAYVQTDGQITYRQSNKLDSLTDKFFIKTWIAEVVPFLYALVQSYVSLSLLFQ